MAGFEHLRWARDVMRRKRHWASQKYEADSQKRKHQSLGKGISVF
ncbi:conserved hypothetical protein [delta proteobacterium NaphS2]|nr:conserved hypothetical protein [delta proteobacterium NaphS2]